MNWVPLFFIDDVCHQLPSSALKPVRQLSGSWSTFGAEHGEKRRKLKFVCQVNYREVSYSLREAHSHKVTVEDLNLEFDRITVFYSAKSDDRRVSLREFERVVLPTIAPLVTNCSWLFLVPQRKDQNRILFQAFKNCPGFNNISVQEQGEDSRHFLARQVQHGNVQTLSLLGKWPEPDKLAETLKIFVSSTRFHALISRDFLRDDSELFELFLERALANELKRGARIRAPSIFETSPLAFHPECRHNEGTKDGWRIPDLNLRIALRYFDFTLEVEVE